jgi:hypothetical protein
LSKEFARVLEPGQTVTSLRRFLLKTLIL